MLNEPAIILLLAILTDRILGDPVYRFHPVRLIGIVITKLEGLLRANVTNLKVASVLLPLLTLLCATVPYILLINTLNYVSWILNLFLTYSFLAWGDLIKHAQQVQKPLERNDLMNARRNVQRIVGRDASILDKYGVARATIESVSENYVDGVLSSIFWYTVGALFFQSTAGAVGCLIAFKVVSTLDSMVGYKSEEYRVLGYVSARLDDMLNYIPARLSIPLISLASILISANWVSALRIGLRDRRKHSSPNAAHAEAAMAGALNLKLGGPTYYAHGTTDKPWLGDGKTDASTQDVAAAIRIIDYSSYLTTILSLLTLLALLN